MFWIICHLAFSLYPHTKHTCPNQIISGNLSKRRSALGFLWRNDAKAETPVLWPPHAKS